ncbi:reverse transcriptase domain-containing protein [Tanacetum coccineum]
MSSPNHPTSDIVDAFSSNFPDYIPASPDYVPASPGKTYSSTSNSFGESSCKTSVERHEEQIEGILNHLDELPLDRVKHIKDEIKGLGKGRVIIHQARAQIIKLQKKQLGIQRMPPKRTSTSNIPAMTQAAIRKLVAGSVTTALEAQVATMARAVGLIRWFERTESVFSRSKCAEENKVTFATGTFTDDALSWWNAYAQPMGVDQANQITWTELKTLLTNKYCPQTEVRKMEDELYNMIVKGNDLKPYVRRFQELTVLCPNMVPNTEIHILYKNLTKSHILYKNRMIHIPRLSSFHNSNNGEEEVRREEIRRYSRS